ncbi:MAG: ABC transporter ATP-binding protein [Verrucomicrobiaceae bacterium]|nr:MAG: ABC transporter ATP-binding protein [Verrucomicrobiaceae bacterium]
MIELQNLTKAYPVKDGFRYILRDVSLVIPTKTNVAILGPNGAGKSTFLRLIGGAEAADSGAIVTDQDISWPLGLNSGFQGSLTGRQNVLFVCRINGLDKQQIRHVVEQVVDFAEIREYFDMPVNTYSSGMRARLTFGLSMAFRFDVYLVDELTSVGDASFRRKAKAAFDEIRSRASLIFVSHNMSTLQESCESALFIRNGLAEYYPRIKDGIEAYDEYVLETSSPEAKEAMAREMAIARRKQARREKIARMLKKAKAKKKLKREQLVAQEEASPPAPELPTE